MSELCFMKRILRRFHNHFYKMANLPPRKIASSNKTSKQDACPLQILLQMGFPRHRALKALSATGNRSVQLASDWLLTHVNDTHIDTDEPREYIFYASPTGPLLSQLLEFWEKSKKVAGWNGAHNFPPHITLVSFFKAPDETSLQIAKAVKHVVENVGDPPNCPLKLEPYISHNFMGLFVSEEHADYLKKIAVQYVKLVSSALGVTVDTYEHLDALGTCFPWCTVPQEKTYKSINLEPHVKSLHITLAYHFDVAAFDALKALVEEMQPLAQASWELRLYSRDPRFAKHQVHKVTQGYEPKASDELELVLGDYVYVEDKEIDSSPDGWVHGTSWLTGVSGYLPAVFTRRTAESDAWTLHRAISLGNNNSAESRSESDSNTDADGEMTTYPHEDAEMLGHAMSEECFKTWGNYWDKVKVEQRSQGILGDLAAEDWKTYSTYAKGDNECSNGNKVDKEAEEKGRRWVFTLRHGERVDLTYGNWVDFCFDEHDKYTRKDLNLPLTLGKRTGGRFAYAGDSPLTRLGNVQAFLVGEGLRLSGVDVRHVYASAALRCVETAHQMLLGLQAGPEVKIRVEPGLFEFKMWHLAKGIGPFMTPEELHKAGYNVDLDYKPYVNLDLKTPETVQEFYDRNEKVIHSAVIDTRAEGGNVIFVGHASTLDMVVRALSRLNDKEEAEKSGKKAEKSKEKAEKSKEKAETGEEGEDDEDKYKVSSQLLRVPYCALSGVRGRPWRLAPPPCPPSLNSSSGRFDWKILLDPHPPSPYPPPPQHSKTN